MIRNYYDEMLKLFAEDLHILSQDENPYLLLRPPGVTNIYKDELRIKRKAEWENLGFKVKIDNKYGGVQYQSFSKNLLTFSFQYNLNLSDERIIEAIQTNKKVYINIQDIIDFLKIGYTLDDIISIPEDLKYYVLASLSYSNLDLINALSEVKKALEINAYEDFYELYFLVLLDLKKDESFEDYINHYSQNYDRIIHNETLFKWLRLLLKKQRYKDIVNLVDKIKINLENSFEDQYLKESTIKKFAKYISKIYDRAKISWMSNQLVTNEEVLLSNILEIQALIRILTKKGVTNEDEIMQEIVILKGEMEDKISESKKMN